MILNFKSTEAPKHIYKSGEFDHRYSSGDITIYLKADTKNSIFKTRYICPDELTVFFENLAVFIQDKNLDALIQNLGSAFLEEVEQAGFRDLSLFDLEVSVLHFREALLVYRGDLREVTTLNSEELICRCVGIDLVGMRNIFVNAKGSKRDILKDSSASLICGECSSLLKESLIRFTHQEQLYEGKDFQEWTNEIESLLNEFHFYSPKEFGTVTKIKVSNMSLPALELELIGSGEMPSESLARTSLANYLGKELKIPLDIKILFHS